jgi:hypothetical protein
MAPAMPVQKNSIASHATALIENHKTRLAAISKEG